jgi:mannose-1-phosphate guanylyltransferase/mannose-1-phosphate guanylyltransferase/mannose-6-phosphate isomerase
MVVAGSDQADAVRAEAPGALLIVEPAARGTAAAVALAALAAEPEELLLVMPSDHFIRDEAALRAAVETARPLAEQDWLVTFGIEPDRPETGYGYIRTGEPLGPGAWKAERFAEKPDVETARAWIEEGGWSWNSGLFLFARDAILAALESYASEMMAAARAGALAGVASASLDKAVMEKAPRVAVVPVDMGWSDIGSWEALHALGPRDPDDNLLSGDVVAPGSRGCLVRSDGPVVVALGVSDLVVVATERAVLVVRRCEAQRVGEAVAALQARRKRDEG